MDLIINSCKRAFILQLINRLKSQNKSYYSKEKSSSKLNKNHWFIIIVHFWFDPWWLVIILSGFYCTSIVFFLKLEIHKNKKISYPGMKVSHQMQKLFNNFFSLIFVPYSSGSNTTRLGIGLGSSQFKVQGRHKNYFTSKLFKNDITLINFYPNPWNTL